MSFEAQQSTQELRIIEKLTREMGPELRALLAEPTVIEISVNADQKLWVERAGRPAVHEGYFEANKAEALMMTLASMKGETITRDSPAISHVLPDGSRFQGLMPPITVRPAFSIRKRAARIFTLEQYVEAGTMTAAQMAVVKRAADDKKNMLVVGATSTGKTTFMNAIIHYLSEAHPADRLHILEDTPEIQSASANVLFMETAPGFDFDRLLHYSLRMAPKRILVGEVRSPEAAQHLLQSWNSGHSGGICTTHANGADEGLIRIETLAQEAMVGPISRMSVVAAVNYVVSIISTPAGRRVSEVLSVNGHDGIRYLTTKEA